MLLYLNSGRRAYWEDPIPPRTRRGWEFQAVIRGAAVPTFSSTTPEQFSTRTLWVFAPSVVHGWATPPRQNCTILVFHFDHVPNALRTLAEKTPVEVSLSPYDIRALQRVYDTLVPHYRNPTLRSSIFYDWGLLELSIYAMRNEPDSPLNRDKAFAHQVTQQALAWYTEHMEINPSIEDAAAAVHMSSSHLRRLFHNATGQSPLAAFREVQMQRAIELLIHSNKPIKTIALACGFSDPAGFSRCFHQTINMSPLAYREKFKALPGADNKIQ